MKRIVFAGGALVAAMALAAAPALAQNNYSVRDGNGNKIQKCSVQQPDGSQADCQITVSLLPALWAANTPLDLRNYSGGEIQITAISGTVTFTRSFDGVTYLPVSAQDANYSNVSPTATGFYSIRGGGFLRWSGTATILVRGYN